ncbi:guanylate kinase [bacterium]|nr:guanylate kinase [bacterium]NCQ55276.1 guanylate kinase [Candidatus Parcubacteria bacterium]NCS67211.1 guanylate kinase [Candidatus Peregrinibacteria bacterium]NCS96466.1 guanylate kinase [bacterium]
MTKTPSARGKIFFFSGPSGVGKGTLINYLRETKTDWIFPPSCTTRAPRPGEIDGETYFFITKEEFEARIKKGDFLEYAHVHGDTYYGTLKAEILEPIAEGKTVIREFDVQGFSQARERLDRNDFVSIFLRPAEDLDTLVRRIKERAPITEEELAKRVNSMEKELELADIYDYQIFSEDGNLEKLFNDAEAIIRQEQSD